MLYAALMNELTMVLAMMVLFIEELRKLHT